MTTRQTIAMVLAFMFLGGAIALLIFDGHNEVHIGIELHTEPVELENQ